jgi:hypothetical protein
VTRTVAARLLPALLVAGCASGPKEGVDSKAVVEEAEEGAAPASIVECWCASKGKAMRLERGATWSLEFEPAPVSRQIWLRISSPTGGTLVERADEDRRTALPATIHRERFEWRAAGWLPSGAPSCQIWIDSVDPVLVDQWSLRADAKAPPADASPGVWTADSGKLELRAADGASVPDPTWALLLLREQRDVVATLLGRELARPLVLVALPASTWPRERVGAFQNGVAIFLRDDEIHLPWRGYAHEIVHVHEEERGVPLPWFLSEGIACTVALEVEVAILGKAGPVAEKLRGLEGYFDGDVPAADAALLASRAPFLLDGDPEDDATRAAAYRWSTALVRAAARRGGAGFHRRLQAALDAHAKALEEARATRAASNDEVDAGVARVAAGLLEEAASADLGELFDRAGLPHDRR